MLTKSIWKNGVGVIACDECDGNLSLVPHAETSSAVTPSMHSKAPASVCTAVWNTTGLHSESLRMRYRYSARLASDLSSENVDLHLFALHSD